MLRRIVRDYRFRTIRQRHDRKVGGVRKAKISGFFPYQENADAMFNSAMLYELAALRKYAEPILMEVLEIEEECRTYRLLRFLRYFNYIHGLNFSYIPFTEFLVGGSSFSY